MRRRLPWPPWALDDDDRHLQDATHLLEILAQGGQGTLLYCAVSVLRVDRAFADPHSVRSCYRCALLCVGRAACRSAPEFNQQEAAPSVSIVIDSSVAQLLQSCRCS